MHSFTGYTKTRFTVNTKNVRVKVQKLHTYVQAYMIYTIIYPWFFVLSLIVSHSLPIIADIITTVELCMCVCVFAIAWLLTSFSYSTTALHFITWCQEWFSLRKLLAVLTLAMMFQLSWLEAVVLVAGPIGLLNQPQLYGIALSCVKPVFLLFRERRNGGF